MSGQYQRAMAEAQKRRIKKDIHARIWQIISIALLLYLATIPAVWYWAWEVSASIAIDALVYLIIPGALLSIFIAVCQNFGAIIRAIANVFRDVRDMLP